MTEQSYPELRYFFFRLARLVAMITCEIGMVYTGMFTVMLGYRGLTTILAGAPWDFPPAVVFPPYYGWYVELPMVTSDWGLLFSGLSLAAFVWFFMLTLACGTPYRYKTSMPGLPTKNCDSCNHEMHAAYWCSLCKSFQFSAVGRSMVWALSLVVTLGFVVHDLITFGLLAGKTSV